MKSKVVHGENKSMKTILMEVIKKDGPKGLFKGIQMSIFANAVYGFIYFTLYHHFKELFRGH